MNRRRHEYVKAIAGTRWRDLRRQVLERDGYTCRICLQGGRPWNELEVHHITYERLGRERPEDLAAICSACHGRVHDIGDLKDQLALGQEVADSDEVARWFRVLGGEE